MAESHAPRPAGILAEFDSPRTLRSACERIREEGYRAWDAHTPYPMHGLERAMGLRRSRLPWIVLVSALLGGSLGMALQVWVHAVDYPLVISAKPFVSWQAFIPVTFELTILFGSVAALLGMLGLNKLPRHHNWLFESERFERATDHRFFVSIDASDTLFDEDRTGQLLHELGAVSIETVRLP